MTTIAYKDGIIACDGRATSGYEITEDNFDKMVEVDGVYFFLSGTICDFDNFIDCYLTGAKPTKGNETAAFVYDDKKLYKAAICTYNGFWKRKLNLKNNYSIGSGDAYALSAMDCGKTAKEAVEHAMKRDTMTGGTIKEYKLSELAKSK